MQRIAFKPHICSHKPQKVVDGNAFSSQKGQEQGPEGTEGTRTGNRGHSRDKNREQRAQKVQEQGTEGTEEQAADDNHKACRNAKQVWCISRQASDIREQEWQRTTAEVTHSNRPRPKGIEPPHDSRRGKGCYKECKSRGTADYAQKKRLRQQGQTSMSKNCQDVTASNTGKRTQRAQRQRKQHLAKAKGARPNGKGTYS